jgi:hypothetical protein
MVNYLFIYKLSTKYFNFFEEMESNQNKNVMKMNFFMLAFRHKKTQWNRLMQKDKFLMKWKKTLKYCTLKEKHREVMIRMQFVGQFVV